MSVIDKFRVLDAITFTVSGKQWATHTQRLRPRHRTAEPDHHF
jgi:hypothetical protein